MFLLSSASFFGLVLWPYKRNTQLKWRISKTISKVYFRFSGRLLSALLSAVSALKTFIQLVDRLKLMLRHERAPRTETAAAVKCERHNIKFEMGNV